VTSIVEMEHITKEFSGIPALRDITLNIEEGEIHALLGENGAGKSTLMKILSGAYVPTSGTITIDGVTHTKLETKESADAGIRIIYQELSVIPQISILENIFVGQLLTKKVAGFPIVDRAAMRARAVELLDQVGLRGVSPDRTVGTLSISQKQMVEIARAIAFDARVIVMDEPTSSLTEDEIKLLFTIVRQLKQAGTSIVFISHKLSEVMELCDCVTVLKDGVAVSTLPIEECSVDTLVKLMVGRELQDKYLSQRQDVSGPSELVPVLEVENLTRRDYYVRNVSFTLYRGEILGFSGLVGAGRSELMSAIYGAAKIRTGTIKLNGVTLRIKTPYSAFKAGIAMVTEDRRETGFFKNFSIRRNIGIGRQIKSSYMGGLGGLLNFADEKRAAEQQVAALSVKCRDIEQNIVELSGGNQQKVILGRLLAAGCSLIIFDEPTKGIDVGTKSAIYTLMRGLAEQGIGVIVVSSDLPEVLSISDRIIVFADGAISAIFTASEATEEKLIRAAVQADKELTAP